MKRFSLILIIGFIPVVFAQTHQNITFKNDSLTFYGTLSIPAGAGPFPVAILVHGSGPNDRNQTLPVTGTTAQCLYPGLYGKTVRNFRDIGDYLSSKNIAVLRYDKRTYTYQASLDPAKISYYDMVGDIHAAIDFVKTRAEINPEAVILIGHSKGGNQVALVAKQRNEVSHVISLATAATGIDTILADQIRYIYRKCADSLQGEQQAQHVLQLMKDIRDDKVPPSQMIMGASASFWKEWIDVTDSAVYHYQQIKQPVLFIQGDDDLNVPVKEIQKFQQELSSSNNDFYIFAGVNHFLTTSSNPVVAAPVLDTIYNWLQKKYVDVKKEKLTAEKILIRYAPGLVSLKFSEPMQKVYLFSIDGRLVKEIPVNAEELNLSGSGFKKGVYFIKAVNEKGYWTEKIVF
jgi:alpha-beta hydrolase superfamily lysophospholipase